MMTDEAALWLKARIFMAWSRRHKVASQMIGPLSCYSEIDPKIEKSGKIDDVPVVCGADDCCLRLEFTSEPVKTAALLKACDSLPAKAETERRRRALKGLDRVPGRALSEKDCRALGDAVFVLQCPTDAVVLTTNIADHKPLALAVGVDAVPP